MAGSGPAAPATVAGGRTGVRRAGPWPAVTGAAGYVVTSAGRALPGIALTRVTGLERERHHPGVHRRDSRPGSGLHVRRVHARMPAATFGAGAHHGRRDAPDVDGGARVSPYAGGPVDVSCPTTTWCLAVGRSVSRGSGPAARGRPPGAADPTRSTPTPTTSWPCRARRPRSASPCSGTAGLADLAGGLLDASRPTTTPQGVSCWSTTACGLAPAARTARRVRAVDRRLDRREPVTSPAAAAPGRVAAPTSTCSLLTQPRVGVRLLHRVSGTTATTKFLALRHQGELSCVSSTWCMAVVEASTAPCTG